MDELEELRQKKLREMQMNAQQDYQKQNNEEAQLQQQITALEQIVKPKLEKQALERYGTLKLAHAEKAVHVLVVLAQLIQKGQIVDKIGDSQLKDILKQLTPQKRDIKIQK